MQAIAAMAYGTESVPKVYKIFGPGNQYVTAAKQLVSLRDVAIDMPAGPSEVEVLADASASPVFVAADLLSQAEHGIDSQAMLITTSEKLQMEVMEEVERQLAKLPRREIAAKSLENSKLILVKDMDEALELTNAYAPEHLIVETENYMEVAERVTNAGSVLGVRRRTGTDPSKDAAIRDREFERLSAENGAGWLCGQAGTARAEGVGLPDAPKQQQLEPADPQSA